MPMPIAMIMKPFKQWWIIDWDIIQYKIKYNDYTITTDSTNNILSTYKIWDFKLEISNSSYANWWDWSWHIQTNLFKNWILYKPWGITFTRMNAWQEERPWDIWFEVKYWTNWFVRCFLWDSWAPSYWLFEQWLDTTYLLWSEFYIDKIWYPNYVLCNYQKIRNIQVNILNANQELKTQLINDLFVWTSINADIWNSYTSVLTEFLNPWIKLNAWTAWMYALEQKNKFII